MEDKKGSGMEDKKKSLIRCKIENRTRFCASKEAEFNFANIIPREIIIEIPDGERTLDIKYSGEKDGCFFDSVGLKKIKATADLKKEILEKVRKRIKVLKECKKDYDNTYLHGTKIDNTASINFCDERISELEEIKKAIEGNHA